MKEENKKENENKIMNVKWFLFQNFNNIIYIDNLYIYIVNKAILYIINKRNWRKKIYYWYI